MNCLSVCGCGNATPTTPKLQEKKEKEARITAIALVMISLFLFGVGYILFGVGTLPAQVTKGLGILPYIGGSFFVFTSLGLLGFATMIAVKSCYHRAHAVPSPS